ncbi:methyltransferase [Ottowia thiooxydans]|uniref:methyltransferase n=1 Tax=Ottowia thiooxydans TaxID=219182 RepID=UPI0004020F66|nr:methyltransferase [Ottowia thiooxydans]
MNPAYLACGGWIASAVGAATQLGVPDLLSERPRTAAELAQATECRPEMIEKLMGLLCEVGLFELQPEGQYVNTADGSLLTRAHPHSLRHFSLLASGVYQRGFMEVLHTLKTGQPGLEKHFGFSLMHLMEQQREEGEIYDLAMAELTRPVGAALAAELTGMAEGLIIDIGGGRGMLLRALLAALPADIRGLCFDRSDVCARARVALAAEQPGLVGRLDFEAGDFFASVPKGGDLYLLKNVLHNWNDANCHQLLTVLRGAMKSSARLWVVEPPLDGGMPGMYKALDNLMQSVVSEAGSTGRTQAGLCALVEGAGWAVTSVGALTSGQTLFQFKAQP